jgi:hypothetical protein
VNMEGSLYNSVKDKHEKEYDSLKELSFPPSAPLSLSLSTHTHTS